MYNSSFSEKNLFSRSIVHNLINRFARSGKSYSDVVKNSTSGKTDNVSVQKPISLKKIIAPFQHRVVHSSLLSGCNKVSKNKNKMGNVKVYVKHMPRVSDPKCCSDKLGQKVMGEFIEIKNRFHILANMSDVNDNSDDDTVLKHSHDKGSSSQVKAITKVSESRSDDTSRDYVVKKSTQDTAHSSTEGSKYNLGLLSLAKKCENVKKAKMASFNRAVVS